MISDESKKRMGWAKNKWLTAYLLKCQFCGVNFKTVPTSTKQKTCSRQCSNALRRSRRIIIKSHCLICKTEIISSTKRIRRYCSNKCKGKMLGALGRRISLQKSSWGQWANRKSAKLWFVNQYNGCMICGYAKVPEILELHHIDRDSKNNNKNNLMLLCPNCHSENHWEHRDGQFANNRGRYAIDKKGNKNTSQT